MEINGQIRKESNPYAPSQVEPRAFQSVHTSKLTDNLTIYLRAEFHIHSCSAF
jgi:hypothetical protein